MIPVNEHNNKEKEEFDSRAAKINEEPPTLGAMGTLITLCDTMKAERIIEIACGTGDCIRLITSQCPNNCTIYGTDISGNMLEFTKKKFENYDNFNLNPNNSIETIDPSTVKEKITVQDKEKGMHIKLLQTDCEKLPFEDNQFDAYLCNITFEHVSDYQQAFREMYRVLRKGGRFAFTIWAKKELVTNTLLDQVVEKYGIEAPSSMHYKMGGAEPSHLIKFLKEIGFNNVKYEFGFAIRQHITDTDFYFNNMNKKIKQELEKIKETDRQKYETIINDIKETGKKFFDSDRVPALHIAVIFGQK